MVHKHQETCGLVANREVEGNYRILRVYTLGIVIGVEGRYVIVGYLDP